MSEPLFVHQYGRGPAQWVGLHGWNGTGRTFEALSAVATDASIIAFDLPGFGESAPPATVDMDGVVGPLAAYLQAETTEPLTLIGSCAGCVWALELALRLPGRVRRLVLVDPFAYVPWYFALLTWPVLGWFFYWVSFAQPLGRWLTNLGLSSKRKEGTDLTGDFAKVRHDVAHAYLRLLCAPRDLERYRELASLQIELLAGESTFGAVHRSVSMFRKIWPNASAHVIAGAAHLPLAEQTASVAEIMSSPSSHA